jgi:hypothetical protein
MAGVTTPFSNRINYNHLTAGADAFGQHADTNRRHYLIRGWFLPAPLCLNLDFGFYGLMGNKDLNIYTTQIIL